MSGPGTGRREGGSSGDGSSRWTVTVPGRQEPADIVAWSTAATMPSARWSANAASAKSRALAPTVGNSGDGPRTRVRHRVTRARNRDGLAGNSDASIDVRIPALALEARVLVLMDHAVLSPRPKGQTAMHPDERGEVAACRPAPRGCRASWARVGADDQAPRPLRSVHRAWRAHRPRVR